MRTLFFLSLLILVSCQPIVQENSPANVKEASFKVEAAAKKGLFANTVHQLDAYWHQGKGEINVYKLQQNRYQNIHEGQAVIIFVSEDFLTDKHVKNDRYQSDQSTPIIKTNAIARFNTGIYDYSMMTSVFTPVKTQKWPQSFKVSNSIQDWCGQAFSQINIQETGTYKRQSNSYFENEGDTLEDTQADLLEDELMNRIRMGWEYLPEGNYQIIPAMNFLRLKHQKYKAYEANMSLSDYTGEQFSTKEGLKKYSIHYPDFDRTLEIIFQQDAPYIIEGWIDTYPSAFDQKQRSTLAIRETTALRAYWNENTPKDSHLRTELGLVTVK